MRRLLIQTLLPFCFCLVPPMAAVLVAMAIPRDAMAFFLTHIGTMDALILILGALLFALQMPLCWRALRWRGSGFNESADRWVNHLAQAAEWFPMLGLLGTVGGILQTFGSISGSGPIQPHVIIEKYAPAITATGAGLFMAFINILPPWIVIMGRDLIVALGGRVGRGGRPMIVMPRRSVTRFFIPLIDVLLLLFVIFLLMPFSNLEELEEKRQAASELGDSVDSLERELVRRTQEVHKLEDARASADELDRLRAELEKLRNAGKQPLHQRTAIYVIDIDGKTGDISYYDTARTAQPIVRLANEKAVHELIDRHQRDADGREVYYLFLLPRPETQFPTRGQRRDYRAWFAKVGHSLKEAS